MGISARCVALASAAALASGIATAPTLARASDVRDVPLVDQSGAHFTLRDLAGAPTAVAFVASRCADACPIVNAEFARLRERLRRAGGRARLVTISLDPAYDTPFVFAKLARSYTTSTDDSWRFVTGAPRAVRAVERAFGVTTGRRANGIPESHDTFVYVLDRRVRLVRTLLLSTTVDVVADATLRTLSHSKTR